MSDNFDLINIRKQAKYSQAILASILGVSRAHLANMENGRKPLNDSALAFIERRQAGLTPYDIQGKQKRNNQVVDNKGNNGKNDAMQLVDNKRVRKAARRSAVIPTFSNSKAWEKWWWQDKHAKCLVCSNSCKQSCFISIIACPQFKQA